jgi:Domain of Unknown Function (DUF1080)
MPPARAFRPAGPILAAAALVLLAAACGTTGAAPGTDPDAEEWVRLFDGRSLDAWIPKVRQQEPGVNFAGTFRVDEGAIQVRYDGYDGEFDDRFGHLFYRQPFSHYRLVVEYRFVGQQHAGAPEWARRNSGVMLHAQDPRTMTREQDFPISVEMQFLGGLGDGRPRPTANMCSPGTEVVYRGETHPQHCLESASETYHGDRWVRVEALVLGDSLVAHIVEGDTVLAYGPLRIGGGVVAGHDPAVKADGTPLGAGFIALQSEGHPIDFRRVELLDLKGCTDPRASNYKRYYVAPDSGSCTYDE